MRKKLGGRRTTSAWPRIATVILVAEVAFAVCVTLACIRTGVTLDLNTLVHDRAVGIGLVGLAWLIATLAMAPRFANACAMVSLYLVGVVLLAIAQYPALAGARPYIDGALASADARLGIDVPALTRFIAEHPWLAGISLGAYHSFLPQLALTLGVVSCWQDPQPRWEFLWEFLTCAVIAIGCLALWPSEYSFTYLHYTPLFSVDEAVHQLHSVRTGALGRIPVRQLQGLVSMPSFHTAAGCAIAWAYRGRRWLRWPMGLLNGLLVVSTVTTGMHYAVDTFAGVVLFAVSAALWRLVGLPLLKPHAARSRLLALDFGPQAEV